MRNIIITILLLSGWFANAQEDLILVNNQIINNEAYVHTTPTTVNVTSVSLDQNTYTLPINSTVQLTETVLPTNATDKTGTWASSDETVATVSSSGLVTWVSDGTTNITFTTTDGSFVDTCVITAEAVPVTTGVFDGAVGYGADWTFTSNYEVRVVTNLNNTGTGSFREAVESSSTYDGVIVVFNGLSGLIEVTSPIYMDEPHQLYVAGQTSENGIFITNASGSNPFQLLVNGHPDHDGNPYIVDGQIIRGLGIGLRDNTNGNDVVQVWYSKNVIYDKCSFLYGIDENFNIRGCENVTVQNCLIADGLGNDGSSWFHKYGALTYFSTKISYFQNLFAHIYERTPEIQADGSLIEVVRSMNYNSYTKASEYRETSAGTNTADVHYTAINHYTKAGANSHSTYGVYQSNWFDANDDTGRLGAIRIDDGVAGAGTAGQIQVYAKGNINTRRPLATITDEYEALYADGASSWTDDVLEANKLSEANMLTYNFPLADYRNNILTNTELETLLTGTDGVGTFQRNDQETRILSEVVNGTGSWKGWLDATGTEINNAYALPTISAGTIITDTDNDGIPDSEEATWGNDTFGYLHSID